MLTVGLSPKDCAPPFVDHDDLGRTLLSAPEATAGAHRYLHRLEETGETAMRLMSPAGRADTCGRRRRYSSIALPEEWYVTARSDLGDGAQTLGDLLIERRQPCIVASVQPIDAKQQVLVLNLTSTLRRCKVSEEQSMANSTPETHLHDEQRLLNRLRELATDRLVSGSAADAHPGRRRPGRC